ncbi:hypothetical protein ELQ90_04730 [Labedella phragmitis]|uniref:Ammonium transporter n=2 Tax=Labedella TaxID=390250 RepID=A0A3S5CIG2_9MICO|nr:MULTISPECIES: hypothetical protein [Labedella]RWZ51429.1 hypothetical protein ELQ90_04730 [Labedella phragmitis]RWZ58340.1 hypothetical protein ELQ92_15080 [Labedella populi]
MTSKVHVRARLTGGLLATVLAAVLTTTLSTGTASATTPALVGKAPSSTQAQATAECAAQPANVETVGTDGSAEMTLLDGEASAAAASQATSLAEAAGIAPQTSPEFVKYEGVKAYALDIDGVKATSVTFPLEGGDFIQPSNVSYIVDEAGQLSQYSESTVVERADGLIDLHTYRDGALIHSAQIDPSTLSAQSASAKAMDPTTCLMAVLGVSAVVAGIILVLCGGSCSVPVTPPTATICAACIAGIAVVGGASIPAVMGCFNGG